MAWSASLLAFTGRKKTFGTERKVSLSAEVPFSRSGRVRGSRRNALESMAVKLRISLLHRRSGETMSIFASCSPTRNQSGSASRELRVTERRGDETNLRVERELGHDGSERSEVSLVVEGADVVEELERTHDRLGRGRVHVVAVKRKHAREEKTIGSAYRGQQQGRGQGQREETDK